MLTYPLSSGPAWWWWCGEKRIFGVLFEKTKVRNITDQRQDNPLLELESHTAIKNAKRIWSRYLDLERDHVRWFALMVYVAFFVTIKPDLHFPNDKVTWYYESAGPPRFKDSKLEPEFLSGRPSLQLLQPMTRLAHNHRFRKYVPGGCSKTRGRLRSSS